MISEPGEGRRIRCLRPFHFEGNAQYERHTRSHQFRRSCFAAEVAVTRRAKNDGQRVSKPIHVDGRYPWPMPAGAHGETRIAAASLRDTHESAGAVDCRCHFGRACRRACSCSIHPELIQITAAEPIAAAGLRLTRGTQSRASVSQALERIRQTGKAKEEGAAHRASPPCQRRDAPGSILRAQKQSCRWVDGVTWHDYEVNLECKSRGSRPKRPHRPHPSRRMYIPKTD